LICKQYLDTFPKKKLLLENACVNALLGFANFKLFLLLDTQANNSMSLSEEMKELSVIHSSLSRDLGNTSNDRDEVGIDVSSEDVFTIGMQIMSKVLKHYEEAIRYLEQVKG
jgi:hypothetical protein